MASNDDVGEWIKQHQDEWEAVEEWLAEQPENQVSVSG
jgi:hypothetical protein